MQHCRRHLVSRSDILCVKHMLGAAQQEGTLLHGLEHCAGRSANVSLRVAEALGHQELPSQFHNNSKCSTVWSLQWSY